MIDYTMTIRGPGGVILDAEIDAELRHVRRLAIEDAALRPLLIVTSVLSGMVEGEMIKAHERGEVVS